MTVCRCAVISCGWLYDFRIKRLNPMSFNELVDSFIHHKTTWDELCLEIRCESCFASVFDEVSTQMGSADPTLARLADAFPNHYKNYAKERGIG